MPKPSKLQVLSVTAASVLVAFVASAASMQSNQSPSELGLPPVLTADAASVGYFLKVEGIGGESDNVKYPGFIEIDAYSWGVTKSATFSPGSQVATKPNLQDFHFAAVTSKASPKLFEACANGQLFQTILFIGVRLGAEEEEQEFLKVTLSDAVISSYQLGGSLDGGGLPEDTFSINFSKIEYEYTAQNEDGTAGDTVKGSYSIKAAK